MFLGKLVGLTLARMVALTLFVILPVFAQPSLELYSGLNWPHSPSDGITEVYLSDYWTLGFDVGVSMGFQLTRWMIISPGFEYARYPFDHFFEYISTGERSVQSSSGQSSHIYRFPILLRLIDNAGNIVKPYLSIGGEYSLEDIGQIRIVWKEQDGSNSVDGFQFPSKRYWSYILGMGMVVRTWTHVDIDPSFKYCSNDTDRSCFSVNLGFIYRFEE